MFGCLTDDVVVRLCEGQLSANELDALHAHLDGCEECRQLVAEAASVGDRKRVRLFQAGSDIGRYRLLSQIGSGGMGVVYVAEDLQLNRRVAIKVLHPTAAESLHEAERRLMREAQAMARLAHPNVVSVFDVGTYEGRVFVAMEFIDGITLREWCRQEPRSVAEIVAHFGYAGRGLAAAHSAGLVHRDFKPENVLVAKDGRVRVTDFGLAGQAANPVYLNEPLDLAVSSAGTLTTTRPFVGTPLYMAPEQLLGQPVDARTDQFGFCVSLYEALYGERPFSGKSIEELSRSVMRGEVREAPARTRVPNSARKILLRGLSPSPNDRFPSMEDLLGGLAHRPIHAATLGAGQFDRALRVGRICGRAPGRATAPRAGLLSVGSELRER